MSIHVALHHVSHYKYDRRVVLSPQVVRLRPAPHCRSNILSYSLTIEPKNHFINWQQDAFANYLARLVFPEPTTEFKVTVDLVTEMAVYNPFDFFLEPWAEKFPFVYDEALKLELQPYLVKEPTTPLFAKFLAEVDRTERRTIDFLVDINQRLQTGIRYLIRMAPGVQTPEETLSLTSGSCRDSGWLLVQALRHLGLAARFVSGYLIQLKPDVKALDGPSGTEVDFTDLHAWCEVYLPGAGWIGLDPTSGLFAGEGHIPLACTPQPSSAAPVSGEVETCEVSFSHQMSIARIHESPRVTQPYTDAQWADVLALGEVVDARLNAGDVRLTMGGEPTFVSVDDRDGAEWNTDALGPTKRMVAQDLVQRLSSHYGSGGFLHFGQGKWYPGEQLPRWALSICWRADGQPCWTDPRLFADERQPYAYTATDAKAFIQALARRLGVSDQHVQAGYEDTYYHLWRERQLPINVDPFDSHLADAMERQRLRRVFSQGLDQPVGYALPLKAAERPGDDPKYADLVAAEPPNETLSPTRWVSSPWYFRDERMYLVPGDSPMGFRLPLDALPWVKPGEVEPQIDEDPFAPHGPLPPVGQLKRQADADPAASPLTAPPEVPVAHESAKGITRTALLVEVRDPQRANGPANVPPKGPAKADANAAAKTVASSVIYVFMPPLKHLEDYLALLAAIEATAKAQGIALMLEGYPPPRDVRLKVLAVTPDPGVIEVNIHPASNWAEIVEHTEFLYDAAWQSRLSSEKFMLDGRHTGTGGGNHVVLGGAKAADSPFLRRPDLLASLLAYWHNHPSLSYLFSGLFIGPTSQAPRIDEARNDQVFELEVALGELARHRAKTGEEMLPWIVDRTLRNILIDVTGNTHRSEFCIDKMYSPDSATGRLGLLELRAFEMPPHARMSIVQQLLLRALVARFWAEPYTMAMVRWGTSLHDRFMLPHMVRMDFDDVLAELGEAGFAMSPIWFAPHFEFRFPKVGELNASGVHLVLRNALEPWHVLGEEGGAAGTVRYVDSSLERLEILATGLVEPRHVVTVNGVAVPMQPTGRVGEFVCGVRYRAWQPYSALHPTIPAHAPLTIDLVDTWMQRSMGGGRYHVAHPGGRSNDNFPVNAFEAESRRLSRFESIGHTPGKMRVPPAVFSAEFPFTLDLRTV